MTNRRFTPPVDPLTYAIYLLKHTIRRTVPNEVKCEGRGGGECGTLHAIGMIAT